MPVFTFKDFFFFLYYNYFLYFDYCFAFVHLATMKNSEPNYENCALSSRYFHFFKSKLDVRALTVVFLHSDLARLQQRSGVCCCGQNR